jgi:hypothetical protein
MVHYMTISSSSLRIGVFGAFLVACLGQAMAQSFLGRGTAGNVVTWGSNPGTPLTDPASSNPAQFGLTVPNNVPINGIWKQSGHSQTVIKQDFFQATNTSSVNTTFGQARGSISSATAGSEGFLFDWYTMYAGSSASRMTLGGGLYLGSPTGGDNGTGTLNVSSGYYVNGIALRKPLPATTFYVGPSGSNTDLATCASSSTPCAGTTGTQFIHDLIQSSYDTKGQNVTIQYLDGTYTNHVFEIGGGITSPNTFTLQGHINTDGTCDRTAVVIMPASGRYAFGGTGASTIDHRCFTIGATGTTQTQDFIAYGQGPTVKLRWIEVKNNGNLTAAQQWNAFGFSGAGFLYFDGDLWINGDHQATLYAADNFAAYPSINNTKSTVKTGTLTTAGCTGTTGSPCRVITGLGSTSGLAAGMYVRGNNNASFREGATIVSVDSSTQITVSSDALLSGSRSLEIGGLFVNYVGTRFVYVAQVFATTGVGLNLQAMEWRSCTSASNCSSAGSFTGQKGILRSGAVADFGAFDPTTMPGSYPWFVGGQSGAALKSDATATVLELPAVASGIISGARTSSRIRFTKFVASGGGYGGSLDTSSTAEFAVLGPGAFNFLGNDGAVNYGTIKNINTNASPQIALGVGTSAPDISGTNTAGVHVYNGVSGRVAGIRIQNDDGASSSDVRLYANAGYGQLLTPTAGINLHFGAGATDIFRANASSTVFEVLDQALQVWVPIRYPIASGRVYYVNANGAGTAICGSQTCQAGSDANSGLSIAAPKQTIQAACTAAAALDLKGQSVTIQLSNGTYAAGCSLAAPLIGGTLVIQGDATASSAAYSNGSTDFTQASHGLSAGSVVFITASAPTNFSANQAYFVLAAGLTSSVFRLATQPGGSAISAGSSGTATIAKGVDNVTVGATVTAFSASGGANFSVRWLKLAPTVQGLAATGSGSNISCSFVDFAASGAQGSFTARLGNISCANFLISASMPWLWSGNFLGTADFSGKIVLANTPAFSTGFVYATLSSGAAITSNATTFVGSATGNRCQIEFNSGVQSNGGGAQFLPGNVDCSAAAGNIRTGGYLQ